jgi:ketosteroid isomerase-like protein
MSTTTVIEPGTALNRAWGDAFNAGDLPRLLEFYEPDAVIVPGPGAEPVRGIEAIEGALRWFLGLGGRLEFGESRYWIVSGDIALGSCAFELVGGHDGDGHPVPLAGVTAEVVRRQPDGSWRYVVDHPFGAGA